ncbi:fumarylacetoacetate hydrolase family protein [Microbacterium sp. KKR3/1]|nr:fumarylacetoacetate hydrolase family protein [Microbacterium sp. KKR3/1]
MTTDLNGEERQRDSTRSMIFSVADTIEFISSVMTLEPGDIIATGTAAGVVFEQDQQR